MRARPIVVGIDVGGTFTDFVLLDEERGHINVGKVLTTTDDPAAGILHGLEELLDRHHLHAAEVRTIVHATTLITNAIIERKGAKTALITTAGFRDLLAIGREVRYDLYDLFLRMPPPLVHRSFCREVTERVGADGGVIMPLREDHLATIVEELRGMGVESVAVCFLHAYANDVHERAAARVIAAHAADVHITRAAEVAGEIGEYERMSTAAANAYVRPLASTYLRRLQRNVMQAGVTGTVHIMLSNGGITTVDAACESPIRLIESGPAAGALIAGYYGRQAAIPAVLAFDMGGTTAKLCLVEDGRPIVRATLEVARVHRFRPGSGLPIRVPSVELIELGAGGGSIAHIDALGLLAVGPQSAASSPGPACYGFGGTQPTVTDADLILGYLNAEYFLGGRMPLDIAAAQRAIRRQIGEPLGMDERAAARGIVEVVNTQMATAASVYFAEKGRDPRHYTLVATGGAGPVHAVEVARKIGLRTVLVPPAAGVGSAIGLLTAPSRMDFAQSWLTRLDAADWERVAGLYAGMEERGRAMLHATGVDDHDITVHRGADMRYQNQGHTVAVPVPAGPLGPHTVPGLADAFGAVYRHMYTRTVPGVPIEAVTWRVTLEGPTPTVTVATGLPAARTDASGMPPIRATRAVLFPRSAMPEDVPVYARDALRPGDHAIGPLIIEEVESTTVLGPDDMLRVDDQMNLIITVAPLAPRVAREETEGTEG
jgi:N-methylhydantoinase A